MSNIDVRAYNKNILNIVSQMEDSLGLSTTSTNKFALSSNSNLMFDEFINYFKEHKMNGAYCIYSTDLESDDVCFMPIVINFENDGVVDIIIPAISEYVQVSKISLQFRTLIDRDVRILDAKCLRFFGNAGLHIDYLLRYFNKVNLIDISNLCTDRVLDGKYGIAASGVKNIVLGNNTHLIIPEGCNIMGNNIDNETVDSTMQDFLEYVSEFANYENRPNIVWDTYYRHGFATILSSFESASEFLSVLVEKRGGETIHYDIKIGGFADVLEKLQTNGKFIIQKIPLYLNQSIIIGTLHEAATGETLDFTEILGKTCKGFIFDGEDFLNSRCIDVEYYMDDDVLKMREVEKDVAGKNDPFRDAIDKMRK